MVSRQIYRFDIKSERESLYLRPRDVAALDQITFRVGSALFTGVLAVLARRGFLPSLDDLGTVMPDPYGVLTGTQGLQTVDGGTIPIVLDPICIVIDCRGDGGCTSEIVDC